jgi:hypothetical protein
MSSFALKEALIHYKELKDSDSGPDLDMIEYLCDLLLENKVEYELFMPEIIRCLLLCFPYNHKLLTRFLPNTKAV